jgi:hypothetical protein
VVAVVVAVAVVAQSPVVVERYLLSVVVPFVPCLTRVGCPMGVLSISCRCLPLPLPLLQLSPLLAERVSESVFSHEEDSLLGLI